MVFGRKDTKKSYQGEKDENWKSRKEKRTTCIQRINSCTVLSFDGLLLLS